MGKDEELFYITHVTRHELPGAGLTKLSFYTKRRDKYYLGFDNNYIFNERHMKNLENVGEVIRLSKPLEIEKGEKKGLWVDSSGDIYVLSLLEGITLK